MRKTNYSFKNLRKNSAYIRLQTQELLLNKFEEVNDAFIQFDNFIRDLENQPISLLRNTRLLLASQMLNHIYSALILTENGMIMDVILCERNALETMAYHWLVCSDPKIAIDYNENNILKPVEVRKKLEHLGFDISFLRDTYSFGSRITHVGRESERFNSKWNSDKKGEVLFGGEFSQKDANELFSFLPVLLIWFIDYKKLLKD